jgi:hypothetical protein
MAPSILELRANGDVWEVVRDGRVIGCALSRHGAVNWAARRMAAELTNPDRAGELTLLGVELAELRAVLSRRQVCGLCGGTDFSSPVLRSVRAVYQCGECGLVSCGRCVAQREESPGCFVGHCGRCGSPRITNIEAFPPPAERAAAADRPRD